MYDEEDEGVPIDWENPYDEIRSSEITEIELTFLDNGRKILKEDDKGEMYTQFKFKCVREDISNPSEITFITSSRRLTDEIALIHPIKDKTVKITKTGTGFNTKYRLDEV